jgi:hypothetical protein
VSKILEVLKFTIWNRTALFATNARRNNESQSKKPSKKNRQCKPKAPAVSALMV